jgi:hypothetical protein
MDIEETWYIVNLINLDKDRDQWDAVVHKVLNLQFSQDAKNFLILDDCSLFYVFIVYLSKLP